jgi:hypothetical protein
MHCQKPTHLILGFVAVAADAPGLADNPDDAGSMYGAGVMNDVWRQAEMVDQAVKNLGQDRSKFCFHE